MELKDIKAFLKANGDNDDVKAYLGELSKPSKEHLVEFAGKPEGLEALQSVFDRERTRAIDGFKQKGMLTEIEKATAKAIADAERAIKEKHKINDDPAIVEVEKLRKELESERNEKKREKLRAKVREKLPEELRDILSDRLLGDDEERTDMILKDFAEKLEAHTNKIVDVKLKGGKYTPNKGSDSTPPGKKWSREEIAKLSPEEYEKHRGEIMQTMTAGGIR